MSKVISKLRCYNPSKLDSARGNSGYLFYIAQRKNALLYDDKTVFGKIKEHDLSKMTLKEIDKYIIQKSNEKTNIYRGIISLHEEDALDLGYDKVDEWEHLMKEKIYDIAEIVNIEMPNVEWLAVVHLKKGNPHLHYMMWDKEQQINRYYISVYQQSKIREILTKHIFENELSKYYEIKNESKNNLRDKSIALEIKAFNKDYCKGKLAYTNINDKDMKSLVKQFNNILNELPKTGSLKYSFMSQDVKEDINKFMKLFIENNADLKNECNNYIQNAINIGSLYGNSNKKDMKIKAEKELEKIFGNQFLYAIKDIKLDKLNEKLFIRNFIQEVFRTISILNESNIAKKELYTKYRSNISKQAQKDYIKNKQNSSNIEW